MPYIPQQNDHSPWGKINDVDEVAHGIWHVRADDEYGYYLSALRNQQIESHFKECTKLGADGWYEYSQDAALVEYTFPQYFKPRGLPSDVWLVDSVASLRAKKEEDPEHYDAVKSEVEYYLKLRRDQHGQNPAGYSNGEFESKNIRKGSMTPWGKAIDADEVRPGIWKVATAKECGYYLNDERNSRIPKSAKQQSWNRLPAYGWYCKNYGAAFVEYTFFEELDRACPEQSRWIANIVERACNHAVGRDILRELIHRRTRSIER